ncbi:MAG: glycosyltransferase 87 family protein [bacterium]|nr:MAG: glycosyltransferase 87 family protein [bacterium]
MNRIVLIILTVGILLRIFLASTTYHSDTPVFDFAGKVIGGGNVTNFYDYLWDLPEDHPYLSIYPRHLFNYPPLPYFFLGGASLLTTWIVDSGVHTAFILDFESTLGNVQLNLLLFLLKLPYFIFDIAVAFILMTFFKERKEKIIVFGLWMINPINLYATYMVGQFDIIPTFLSVAALYYAIKKDNLTLSAILLGLGAGFKIFPLLFIVPLAFFKQSWWERIKILFTSGITYALFAYPFIMSEGFRKTALLASQTTKSFYAQIPVSGGQSVILFLVAVIFLYIFYFYHKTRIEFLWQRFFSVLLIFFIFTHSHPQWLLWITPFLIIDLVVSKFKHWPLLLGIFISFIMLVTFFDPGLSIWLFAPINPSLYGQAGIWSQLGLNLDVNLMRSLFHSVFVGIAVYYIYYYFRIKKNEN